MSKFIKFEDLLYQVAIAVVAALLLCLPSCGSDPLDRCREDPDGTFDCYESDLDNVDLSSRDLRDVDVFGSLHGADLSQANLSGVDLSFMYLRDTDFSGADLEGVDFSESILERVDFSGANLSGANFYAAHGVGQNFTGADLSGTNLYGTDWSTWDFEGARADSETVWPDGFDPVAAGVIFE